MNIFVLAFNQIKLHMNGCFGRVAMGDCYQSGTIVEKDCDVALFYYEEAIKYANSIVAYHKIGEIYELDKANIGKAIKWYFDGAVKENDEKLSIGATIQSIVPLHHTSTESLLRLADTNITAAYYAAMLYEYAQDWQKALLWHNNVLKMEVKNNRDISTCKASTMYKIGALYSVDRISKEGVLVVKQNIIEEFNWYKKSAEAGYKYALDKIIAMHNTTARAAFTLAQLYEDGKSVPKDKETKDEEKAVCVTKNMKKAIVYYKIANGLGDADAGLKLGKLCEAGNDEFESLNTDYLPKAMTYYAIAAHNGNQEAFDILKTFADQGDQHAQFTLACEFYYKKNLLLESAKLLMKAAEQQHFGAVEYLNTKFNRNIYFAIANLYEKGIEIKRNITQAIVFYKKSNLQDPQVLIKIGQLCLLNDKDLSARCDAWKYFMQAANLNNREALAALEGLGHDMCGLQQLKLSDLYRDKFSNIERSSYWRQQAALSGVKITDEEEPLVKDEQPTLSQFKFFPSSSSASEKEETYLESIEMIAMELK